MNAGSTEKAYKQEITHGSSGKYRDIAFRDSLEQTKGRMPPLEAVYVISCQRDWPGQKGFIGLYTQVVPSDKRRSCRGTGK